MTKKAQLNIESAKDDRPKLLIHRHSRFYEEQMTNPAGNVIRIKRSKATGAVYFSVSVDGQIVDSFLNLARARSKAKKLYNTSGVML